MLVKGQYQAATGRPAEHGALCYQIRQVFPQREITPEEANKIVTYTCHRTTLRYDILKMIKQLKQLFGT